MAIKKDRLLLNFNDFWFGADDLGERMKEEKLEKFLEVTFETINKMVEDKKVLRLANKIHPKEIKKIEVEIVGKEFYLLFTMTKNGKVRYDILGENNGFEIESGVTEEILVKKVKEFIEKTIQKQRIKNAISPPKRYLREAVGYNDELTNEIWVDLIRDYKNDEIETECFWLMREMEAKKMEFVTNNYTTFMLKIINHYYAISYHKGTSEYKLIKSSNKEEVIKSYKKLINDAIEEEIKTLW